MSVNIQINNKSLKIFTVLLLERINKLKQQIEAQKAEIDSKQNDLEEAEGLLKQLSKFSSFIEEESIIDNNSDNLAVYRHLYSYDDTKPTVAEYNKSWTWEAKMKYILKESGRPMGTADVVKRIMEIEPYLTDRAALVGSVSATFSIKSKPGKSFIVVGKNERNETIYDLADNNVLNVLRISTFGA